MSPPAAGPRAPEAEQLPEQRVAAAEEGLEDVLEARRSRRSRRPAAGAQAVVAEGVVGAAALGVGEHLVGLGGLLELLLGLGVVRVDVGVQLARELAEGLLDLGRPTAPRSTPRTS